MNKFVLILIFAVFCIVSFFSGALTYHFAFGNIFMEIPYVQGLYSGSSALLYEFQTNGVCDENLVCTLNMNDKNSLISSMIGAEYLTFLSTDFNLHSGTDSMNCWFAKTGRLTDISGEYQRGSPKCKIYYEEYDRIIAELPNLKKSVLEGGFD